MQRGSARTLSNANCYFVQYIIVILFAYVTYWFNNDYNPLERLLAHERYNHRLIQT